MTVESAGAAAAAAAGGGGAAFVGGGGAALADVVVAAVVEAFARLAGLASAPVEERRRFPPAPPAGAGAAAAAAAVTLVASCAIGVRFVRERREEGEKEKPRRDCAKRDMRRRVKPFQRSNSFFLLPRVSHRQCSRGLQARDARRARRTGLHPCSVVVFHRRVCSRKKEMKRESERSRLFPWSV